MEDRKIQLEKLEEVKTEIRNFDIEKASLEKLKKYSLKVIECTKTC